MTTEIPSTDRANCLVREGEPAGIIVSTALEQGTQLIVISSRGEGGLKRFLLGSTAEAVLRRAPCPVLAVRRPVRTRTSLPDSPAAERINRILVPVDFSLPARAMLQYAVTIATQFSASLVLVHAVHRINVPSRVAFADTQLRLSALQQARTRLARWIEQFVPGSVQVKQIVDMGEPYDVINRTARRSRADLVVIATHGRTGLKRLVLGSTAERVVRHASCPVLVIR